MSTDSTCPFVAVSPEGVPVPTEDSDPLLYLTKLVNHMNTSFENANSCIRFILYVLLFYLTSLCFAFYLITQQSRVIEDPTFGYCTVNVSNTFQQHSEQLDSLASKLKQFELYHVVSADSLETRFSLYQEKLQNLHDLIGDLESQFEAIRRQTEGEDIEKLEVLMCEADITNAGLDLGQYYAKNLQAIEASYLPNDSNDEPLGVKMARSEAVYSKGWTLNGSIGKRRCGLLRDYKVDTIKQLIDSLSKRVNQESTPKRKLDSVQYETTEKDDLKRLEIILYETSAIQRGEGGAEPLWSYLDNEYRQNLLTIDEYYWTPFRDETSLGARISHAHIERMKQNMWNSAILYYDPNGPIAKPVNTAKKLIDSLMDRMVMETPVVTEKHTLAPVDSVWPFQHESAPEVPEVGIENQHDYM